MCEANRLDTTQVPSLTAVPNACRACTQEFPDPRVKHAFHIVRVDDQGYATQSAR